MVEKDIWKCSHPGFILINIKNESPDFEETAFTSALLFLLAKPMTSFYTGTLKRVTRVL